jgi:hypothetical protein
MTSYFAQKRYLSSGDLKHNAGDRRESVNVSSKEPIREVLDKIDSERFEISSIKSLGENSYEVTGTVSTAPRIDGDYVLILTRLSLRHRTVPIRRRALAGFGLWVLPVDLNPQRTNPSRSSF